MRLLTGIVLAATLAPLAGCDDIEDTVNLQRGAVEVQNGTSSALKELYHPPCDGGTDDGEDRLSGHDDLQPGEILAIDLPMGCRDFKADFADGTRRVITDVFPDDDRRQRIVFR